MRWSGYVQPESYSSNSEYRSDINIMALDNLGQLEYIEYNYFDSSFVSLRTLVSKACELVGWNFAPVIFDTRVVSGEGILIEDAVLNVETFRKKTWWEVLSDVLFSFGLQLAYFDDNAYRISSVANKFDAARIVDIPNHTIESGCTSDIVPPWKELVFKQNYQKIDNAFAYKPSKDSYKFIKETIGNSTGTKNSLFSSDQWLSSQENATNGILFSNPFNYTPQNRTTNVLYNKTFVYNYNGTDTDYIYKGLKTSKTEVAFEFTFKCWNFFMQYTRVGSPVRPQLSIVRGTNSGLDPYQITVRCNIILRTTSGDYYLREDDWILNDSSKYISFNTSDYKLDPNKGVWSQKEDEFTVLIPNIPYDGELRLSIYKSKWEGGVQYQADQEFTVFTSFGFKPYADSVDFTAKESRLTIIESARTKKDIEVSFGELPTGTNSLVFAGGVFQNDDFATPLHDWHRADNLGGVLPLSEIVWRGYVHHFSRFQTNAGEPAGGKVLRGRFPFEGLKLNNTLKYSTKEFAEYYVINSASITGREADLTLMQVKPYTHIGGLVIEDAVETGGGSFASGGGDTYISHVAGSGTLENGKRVYELDEATDIENMSLLVDRQGDEQAHKIYASIFASGNEWRKEFESTEDYLKYKRPAVFDKLVKVPKLGLLNPLTNQYATLKFEPLAGTGAEPPAPSGGGGTFNYNELTNRPSIAGVVLSGDQTLSEYGLWNFGLATQSWVNTRFSSLPAWAMQSAKPQYQYNEILSRPTTLAGYGITDSILNTDVRLSNARPASDVYAWAKQPAKPQYQYAEIGNLAAASVSHAKTSDKSYSTNQLEAYLSDDFVGGDHFIKAIREAPSDWSTRLWMCYKNGAKASSLIKVGWADTISGYSAARLWRNDNANLTTVDWSCGKLTLAKFNASGVATGTVTLTAKTF